MAIPRPPVWARELAGWAIACALAAVVLGHVASDPARSSLLLLDGDSMLNPLVASSLRVGQAQDWAMSPVLFLPEIAVYGMLSLVGMSVSATLALNGAVNLLLLYGAVRLVAGRRERLAHPVSGAVLAFGLFCALALLENGGGRDSLQLASLLTTTTYYSMSVLAAVVTLGLVRRILARGRVAVLPIAALVVLGAVSALSNPLYVLWATVPVAVVLIIEGRGGLPVRALALVEAALVVPAAAGILARMPLDRLIVADPALYAKPGQWSESVDYYGVLLGGLTAAPGGWALFALALGCLALPVAATVRSERADDRLLAVTGWLSPVLTVGWAIAFGTVAARYLQPVVFMPLLSAVLVPTALAQTTWFAAIRERRGAHRPAVIAAAVAAVVLVGAAALQPARIAQASDRAEASVACVTRWIDASHRTGAGQYWTIRPIKARLEDPRQLVQTGPTLKPYLWGVNRADYPGAKLTFAVYDKASFPFTYPLGTRFDYVRCGAYTIQDFGGTPVTLP